MRSVPQSESHPVLQAVQSALDGDVGKGESVCVALSGGMDSVVLLDAVKRLANIRNPVTAVHVHHGLSSNADQWAEFCMTFCEERKVPLDIHRVMVQPDGKGLEAAARDARYAVFIGRAEPWILQAHHADDAVETLLLRLNRGTGLKGLAGIPARRVLDASHALLRPLLRLPRHLLQEYALQHRLSWVEDESNDDTRLDRNFLRHTVFPALENRFPAYRENWLRAAAHAASAQTLLDELASMDVGVMPARLHLEKLRSLSRDRLRNALRYFLVEQGVELPETGHLSDIERRIRECGPEATLDAVIGQHALMHYRGDLYLVAAELTKEPAAFSLAVQPGVEMALHQLGGVLRWEKSVGKGISAARLANAALTVHGRKEGENLKPGRMRPTRTSKNLFQEHGVPPWQRSWLPRLAVGEKVIWIAGLGVDCEWSAGSSEAGWVPFWQTSLQ